MELILILSFYFLGTIGYVLYFSMQKEMVQRVAALSLWGGFLLHTLVIGMGYYRTGHFPAQNLHETLSVMAWTIAGVYLALELKVNFKMLGIFTGPLITILMIAAMQFPDITPESVATFKSFWLPLHIVTIFIGEAGFALAFGVGILYLIQERAIKGKTRGYFYKRLPSLELIDYTGYICIIVGFTTITIGLITGMIYAKMVWGRFWAWDPKEVWSGISWLVYAILLHERLTVGWRGRNAAIMAIVGFLVLLFTLFGVNFFLEGHHGDFTKW